MRNLSCALLGWALMLVVAGGCAPGATSFIREDVDFSYIRTVAVFPFSNLTQDIHAASRVQSIFLSELLDQDAVLVLEAGETLNAMAQLKLGIGSAPTAGQVQELGKLLGVDAIFFGAVEEYGLERTGTKATYAVTARFHLLETQTGLMIWNAQARADGSSVWRSLFGGGSASLYDVARGVVREAQETLF